MLLLNFGVGGFLEMFIWLTFDSYLPKSSVAKSGWRFGFSSCFSICLSGFFTGSGFFLQLEEGYGRDGIVVRLVFI